MSIFDCCSCYKLSLANECTNYLELSNIKFELAPAYKDFWGTYFIPAPASDYADWIETDPKKIKDDLEQKQKDNNYLIRDLVLLMKYWNVKNGKVYSSYNLERYIIEKSFWFTNNLKEYLYSAVEGLSTANLPDYKKSKVESLKQTIVNTKKYEADGMPNTAEAEIKKAF